MKKVMAMNGFQELDERELMETEGGNPLVWLVIAGLALTLSGCDRAPEEETESNTTNYSKRDLQIHQQAGCTDTNCMNFWGDDCPVRNQ